MGWFSLKLLKCSLMVLLVVLLIWGGLALFLPKEDGVFRVVLDPGHGGKDPGAVVGDYMEKDINLCIALQVRELLAVQEGIQVTMTRDEDIFLELDERADLANKEKADLFISIHANALEDNDSFSGLFTFYHSGKRSGIAPAGQMQAAVVAASGATDRGTRGANYAVLRETKMPAILIETGFMTCPEELARLIDPEYQTKLAQGITNGILSIKNGM